MKILLVGNPNVNPERLLPLVDQHEVYGLWESKSKWGVSVQAPTSYQEIPSITLEEIPDKGIQIVWNLLSPWDGLDSVLSILEHYPGIPLVRHTQGGATPPWHQGGKFRQGWKPKGNYDFGKFKAVLEGAAGVLINAEKYRDCLIAQGVGIQETPYILFNGMAYNEDLIGEDASKLSSKGSPHIAIIGRSSTNLLRAFEMEGVTIHCHTYRMRHAPFPYVKVGQYLGDAHMMGGALFLRALLQRKSVWHQIFSKYDAGIMPVFDPDHPDIFEGVDINVPGRINNYIMAGLPPLIQDIDSATRDFMEPSGCAILYQTSSDLQDKLRDTVYMTEKQAHVRASRHLFSMQHEITRALVFFSSLLKD